MPTSLPKLIKAEVIAVSMDWPVKHVYFRGYFLFCLWVHFQLSALGEKMALTDTVTRHCACG